MNRLRTLLFLTLLSIPFSVSAISAPTISGITHASTASLLYTITGTGFAKGAKLLIGGSAPLSTWQGGTTFIVFQPPKGKTGTVDIVVRNTDGSSVTKKNGFTYPSSAIVPIIRGVAPATGSNVMKAVWGSNFEAGAKVYVNGTLALNQKQIGTQYIVFAPPTGTNGNATVEVRNPGGGKASVVATINGGTSSSYAYQTPAAVYAYQTPSSGGGTLALGLDSSCSTFNPPSTSGPIYHVAVNGNDSNDGSLSRPFATLGRALQGVVPGTRVLIGGGTYNLGSTPMRFSDIHGSAGNPVVITAELGQTPIFDGSGVVNVNYPNEPFISFKDSSYLYLDGFEIFGRAFPADVTSHLDANGRYTGPTYEGGAIGANGSFLTIARMKIHQIPAEAVSISGSDIVIACNQITDVVLGNKDGNTRTGHGYFGDYWPSTIMTWIVDNGHGGFVDWTRRVQYIKNSINGSWGEGLNCLFVDGCDVIGNEVADTYSVMIYMDHARNVRVIGNRLHDNGRANGNFMSIDNEGTYGNGDDSNLNIPYMRQDNILIANNFFGRGGGATIFRYDNPCPGDGCTTNVNNTWSNVRIINNIFSGGSSWSPGAVMDFAKVTGPTAPTGGVISGNIFLNSGGFNLGNPSAWIITNNDFFGSAPSITQGANVSGTLSVDPQFTGPTDGSSWAGLTPRNTAALQVPTLSDVTQDALGQSRNSSMTTAGPIGP